MAEQTETGLLFEDLYSFPDDGKKRELIRGRLHVSPEARVAHGRAIMRIGYLVESYCERHGGMVLPGANVDPEPGTHFEPDVVGASPGQPFDTDGLRIYSPPDFVVEVSSPSTKRYDLKVKRPEYERMGVREFWFVDLDQQVIIVHRLGPTGYGEPERYSGGQSFTTDAYPGLVIAVDDVLKP